ncbi:chemotaxis protein CheD [Tropicimonas isoalkanivorans]|uniref:Probable chemoreceptor glutamine deamidase CheD n=1 Tax=Tropicimonas isoalkanivorans TaxID=441112 RepID=A0A1I1DE17_9RHOB|nr:chemotaxis protein CheD [Tropicimonas isoalkanivorans]SFB70783.1 chemotaxis protein CheD [Tropicimonas isoalkanivorans]
MMEPSDTVVHVGQGEMAVSDCADTMLSTVLGSCVTACIRDPMRKIGGMNHILLPDGVESDVRRQLYGTNSMELLINRLLHGGADRRRLEAKVFGGARLIAGLSDVGQRNCDFVLAFCAREGIPVTASSLGGTAARRVQFWPHMGKARQRLVPTSMVDERKQPREISPLSDVELFA